jgi:broad specificity phosphatase PhoE
MTAARVPSVFDLAFLTGVEPVTELILVRHGQQQLDEPTRRPVGDAIDPPLSAVGRRQANATFHSSHATDKFTEVAWAMDLTPLVADEKLSVKDFTLARVDRLRNDVSGRIAKLS